MADEKLPEVSLVIDGQTFPLFARTKKYTGGDGVNANGVVIRNGVKLYTSINCAPSKKNAKK